MTETPTQFMARAVARARELLAVKPAGFRFDDLAGVLGHDRQDDQGERRLRRVLARMRDLGALATGGHGVFVAGPDLLDGSVLGAGVWLDDTLRRLFADNGGIMSPAEIQAALGLTDDAGKRAVFRALKASKRYIQGLPFAGYARTWRLPDDERRKLPLPGCRLWIDTRLDAASLGRPWKGPILHEVHRRRCEIGAGVRRARERRQLDPEDLLTTDLADVFERCLDAGLRSHHGVGGAEMLGDWWRARAGRMGRDAALAYTWADLEAGAPDGLSG